MVQVPSSCLLTSSSFSTVRIPPQPGTPCYNIQLAQFSKSTLTNMSNSIPSSSDAVPVHIASLNSPAPTAVLTLPSFCPVHTIDPSNPAISLPPDSAVLCNCTTLRQNFVQGHPYQTTLDDFQVLEQRFHLLFPPSNPKLITCHGYWSKVSEGQDFGPDGNITSSYSLVVDNVATINTSTSYRRHTQYQTNQRLQSVREELARLTEGTCYTLISI